MKTVLIDTEDRLAKVIDIADDLSAFYDALGCRCIDIVKRTVGTRTYNIMCDDEGRFKDATPSAVSHNRLRVMFVGNIMLFNDDGNGELVGLSDDDLLYIGQHVFVNYRSEPLLICDYE